MKKTGYLHCGNEMDGGIPEVPVSRRDFRECRLSPVRRETEERERERERGWFKWRKSAQEDRGIRERKGCGV